MIDFMCRLWTRATLYRFPLLVQHAALPNSHRAHQPRRNLPSHFVPLNRRDSEQNFASLPPGTGRDHPAGPFADLRQLTGTMSDFAPAIATGCAALLRAPQHGPAGQHPRAA
jgi:hypothetical protein